MSHDHPKCSWGYDNENGPHTWSKSFPVAAGPAQSPVNLDSRIAVFAPELEQPRPLSFHQPPLSQCSLANTGSSFCVSVDCEVAQIEGGPLTGPYRFAQYHMHWGSSDGVGSEHALNGRLYPAELHLVHWDAIKYASFGAAAAQKDGLAVLGVFIEIGEPNEELEKALGKFTSIRGPGVKTALELPVCLGALLPKDKTYFTYPGSLTTPPCYESVCWIVFAQPITMSKDQLKRLRSLDSSHGSPPEKLVNNYRHLIPLGKRTLRVSKRP